MREWTSRVTRLDSTNVARNKKNVKKEGKAEGERRFQQALQIMRDSFPQSEIENEAQFRSYFHDKHSDSWFVRVAVNNDGDVIGVRTYSYKGEMNLIMLNITAVKKEYARQGVSKALEGNMLWYADKIGERNPLPVLCAIAEVERPDFAKYAGEEGKIRNVIRPAYHDRVSGRWPLLLPDGEPFIYLLPIMATDAERADAKTAGEPLEPEPLMLCIRPIALKREDGMSSKELARLIIWFYKGYLEAECTDVKTEEVNALLAVALVKLAGNGNGSKILRLLGSINGQECTGNRRGNNRACSGAAAPLRQSQRGCD